MSKKAFQHTFRGHIRSVKPANELHGDEHVLHVDISLRVMLDNGDEWDPMFIDLLGYPVGEAENVKTMMTLFTSLPFAKKFDEHVVVLSTEDEEITTLRHCRLDKFLLNNGDAGLTLHVRAPADGSQCGLLSELLGQGVMVDISGEQIEMASMNMPDEVEV